MNYQQWLKEYEQELGHAHPGILLDKVDRLFLQGLYQRGLSPLVAAKQAPEMRSDLFSPKTGFNASAFLDRIHWDYFVGVAGMLLLLALLLGPRIAAKLRQASVTAPSVLHLPVKSAGDFYASDEINIPTTYQSPYSHVPSGSASFGFDMSPWMDSYGFLEPFYAPRIPLSERHPGRHTGRTVTAIANEPVPSAGAIRASGYGGGSSAPASTPIIEQFDVVTSDSNDQGLTGSVTWRVANADSVQILLLGVPVSGVTDLSGTLPYDSLAAGSVFTLRASGGGHVVEQSITAEPN